MESKDLNRIKVMLAEKKRTNKWLAEQLGKDPATVSKWVTNVSQPNVETLIQISKCLGVGVEELLRTDQNYCYHYSYPKIRNYHPIHD